MKKKIVFFDADGTLWWPRDTKHTKHPVWVYRQYEIEEARSKFVLVPGIRTVLKELRKKGIKTIVLSTNPHSKKIANELIRESVRYHGLQDLFDEVYATRGDPKSKGEYILRILKKYGLRKKDSLMVGDSYLWDYSSARTVGVDSLLIETDHMGQGSRVKRKIKNVREILDFV
jgi:magnesium-dependent phosphatase-1